MHLRVSQERFCNDGAPLPSTGSARAAFPGVSSTIRALRLPVPNTRSLMDSLPRPNPCPLRSLPVCQRPPHGPGPAPARYHWLISVGRYTGSPRFLGNPSYAFAPLFDSGWSDSPRPTGQFGAVPTVRKMKTPTLSISKLNHAALASAAYASRTALPQPMQGSLPAGG